MAMHISNELTAVRANYSDIFGCIYIVFVNVISRTLYIRIIVGLPEPERFVFLQYCMQSTNCMYINVARIVFLMFMCIG